MFRPMVTASLGRWGPWTMRPLDDASLGQCVPWTMQSLDNASLGQSIPWTMTMRPLDKASLGGCVSWTWRPWPICPDPGLYYWSYLRQTVIVNFGLTPVAPIFKECQFPPTVKLIPQKTRIVSDSCLVYRKWRRLIPLTNVPVWIL